MFYPNAWFVPATWFMWWCRVASGAYSGYNPPARTDEELVAELKRELDDEWAAAILGGEVRNDRNG